MMDTLIEHKYTVLEIDRMRRATKELMFPLKAWISCTMAQRAGGFVSEETIWQRVESQLRTYMLTGIRPEELESLQKERAKAFNATRPAA